MPRKNGGFCPGVRKFFSTLLMFPCLVAGLSLNGCSHENSVITAHVEGLVTLDGEPLEKGMIAFLPVAGDAPSVGGEIRGGRYSLMSPKANMKVEITASKKVSRKTGEGPNAQMVEFNENIIPPQYNYATTLKVQIDQDQMTADFALKSRP